MFGEEREREIGDEQTQHSQGHDEQEIHPDRMLSAENASFRLLILDVVSLQIESILISSHKISEKIRNYGQESNFFITFAADYEKENALHFLAYAVTGHAYRLWRV